MGNKTNEKDRIGWHYLRDMFYKWLACEANNEPSKNPSPFWVDIDWVLSYFSLALPLINLPKAAITERTIEQLNTIFVREGYFEEQDKEFDFINTP